MSSTALRYPECATHKSTLGKLKVFQDQLNSVRTVKAAFDAALSWVEDESFHATAIYELGKRGQFQLKATAGEGRNGNWLRPQIPDACFEMDSDFVTQAVDFRQGTRTTQIRRHLESQPFAGKAFLTESFGSLRSAMAVPLVGSKRPFGVWVLFKRLNGTHRLMDDSDVEVAELAAGFLSMKLSKLATLAAVEQASEIIALAGHDVPGGLRREGLNRGLQTIVGEDGPFAAAVIRLESSGALRIVAKEPRLIFSQAWRDIPLTKDAPALAWRVFNSGKPEVVNAQDARKDGDFLNLEWIQIHRIQTVACVPLRIGELTLGTLTVYTRYQYPFDEWEMSLLVAFTANLVNCVIRRERLLETEELLRDRGPQNEADHDMLHFLRNVLASSRAGLGQVRDDYDHNKPCADGFDSLDTKLGAAMEILATLRRSEATTRVDLSQFLPEAVAGYVRFFQRVNFRLNNPAGVVTASAGGLSCLLLNVVMNAATATGKTNHEENIEISARPTPDGVAVTVKDNGIGMKEQEKADFLSKLNDLVRVVDRSFAHTGLTRIGEIARESEASVEIDSKEGVGTIVTIHFRDLAKRKTQVK